jgi:hypothetical protein
VGIVGAKGSAGTCGIVFAGLSTTGRESRYIERTPINPVSWSLKLGFDQGQLIEGHRRQLVVGGQDAVDADGNAQHPGDMAAQLELSLDTWRLSSPTPK